jgi:hypothetical protein
MTGHTSRYHEKYHAQKLLRKFYWLGLATAPSRHDDISAGRLYIGTKYGLYLVPM